MSASSSISNTPTVIALLVILIILALVLVFFYKKLNKDTNGQYTIQRMIFAPDGLRDRLRQGVGVVENRFGVHIWPQPRDDEENIGDNDEADVAGGDHDKQNESCAEGEQEENDDGGDDSSSDYSSIDLRERAKMQEKNEPEEEKEEEAAAAGEEDKSKEVRNEEKVGLLVDLTPFTGSAIWSGESKDGNEGNDLTAL